MKRLLSMAAVVSALFLGTPLVWAHGGGMGGGMSGGMGGGTGGWGHMMDFFGQQNMGPDQRYNDRYDRNGQYHYYRQNEERRHAQEDYDRDMVRLHREIKVKEQALDRELEKETQDKGKIKDLHREISDLYKRYGERRAEFYSRWGQDDRE